MYLFGVFVEDSNRLYVSRQTAGTTPVAETNFSGVATTYLFIQFPFPITNGIQELVKELMTDFERFS